MVNVSKALIIAILLSPVLAHGQAKQPDMVLGTIDNNYDLFTPAEVVSAGGGGGGSSLPTPPVSGKYLYEANDSALNWRGITGIVIDALPPMAGKANNCVKVNSTANGLRYADCGSPRVLSNRDPVAPGTALPGTRSDVSRADHRHPTQTIPPTQEVPNPSSATDGEQLIVESGKYVLANYLGTYLAPPKDAQAGAYLKLVDDLTTSPLVEYKPKNQVLAQIVPTLPTLNSGDKASLNVNDSGVFEWLEDHELVTAGLPALAGHADKVLTVNNNATGLFWNTAGGGGGGGGSPTGITGVEIDLADTTPGTGTQTDYEFSAAACAPLKESKLAIWSYNASQPYTFLLPVPDTPEDSGFSEQGQTPIPLISGSGGATGGPTVARVFWELPNKANTTTNCALKVTLRDGDVWGQSTSDNKLIVLQGGGGGGGGLDTTAGVSFKLFEQKDLAVTDISTNTMLPITQTVIATTEFTSGLVGGPFFTVYEGAVTLTITTNKSITAELTTKHTFNDSTTLTTTRTGVYRITKNTESTINLTDFSSITQLPIGGTFVDDQGTTVTIDEDLLAQPVDIETTLKLSASGNTTLTQLGSERPQVTWYQLNPGTGGNPVIPNPTAGGATKALRVNAAGSAYELADFPNTVAPANTAPGGVKSGSPVIGTSNKYAREDHQHTFSLYGSSIPKNPALGGGGSSGTSTLAARTDHIHPSIVPSLTSNKGKYLQVNTAEDGIEWAEVQTGGGVTPEQVETARLEAIRASATTNFITRWGNPTDTTGAGALYKAGVFRALPIVVPEGLSNTDNDPMNVQPVYVAVSWVHTDGTVIIHEYVTTTRHILQLGSCTPGQTIAQCRGSEEFDTGGWHLSKTAGNQIMLAAPTTLTTQQGLDVFTNLEIGRVFQTVSNTWQNWQNSAGVWDQGNGVGMIRTRDAKQLWDWIVNGMISEIVFSTQSTRGSGASERQSFSGCTIKIPTNKFLAEDTKHVFSCFATIVDLANWGVQFTLANYGEQHNSTVVWTNVYLHDFDTDGQANIALTIEAKR